MVLQQCMTFIYAENRFEIWSMSYLMVSSKQIMSDKILATAVNLSESGFEKSGRPQGQPSPWGR